MNIKLVFGIGSSLILHLFLIYILGIIIVSRYVNLEEHSFSAIPLSKSIKPIKKEYQIDLKRIQKNTLSTKPQPLISKNPENIEVPYVIENPPLKTPNFTSNYQYIKGLKTEIEKFSDLKVTSNEFSKLTLFGIETVGEKFFILLDASSDMLTDELGGMVGYEFVKKELNKVLGKLPPGVLFNVALFDRSKVHAYSKKMILATPEHKKAIKEWIKPVNREKFTGPMVNNMKMDSTIPPLFKNVRSIAKAMQEAMRQQSDNIFILCSGWKNMGIIFNSMDRDRFSEYLRKDHGFSREEINLYYGDWQILLNNRNTERKKYFEKRNKFVEKELLKENQIRAKKGMSPRILGANEIGRYAKNKNFPNFKEPPYITKKMIIRDFSPVEKKDFEDYLGKMNQKYYFQQGKKDPIINIVLFQARGLKDKDLIEKQRKESLWFRSLAKQYSGEFSEVKLAEVIIRRY